MLQDIVSGTVFPELDVFMQDYDYQQRGTTGLPSAEKCP